MTAISDQSTIPTWDLPAWLRFACVVAGVLLYLWARKTWKLHRRPGREETLVPRFRPCFTHACPYNATELVMDLRTGHLVIHDVCTGCANRGLAYGWWRRLPEDQP
jgi:hypothetical protein